MLRGCRRREWAPSIRRDIRTPTWESTQYTVNYVAEGVLTGHVWIDVDRDGQRDEGEPMGVDDVLGYQVIPESGQLPWGEDWLDENTVTGTYWGRLKPGRYTLVVHMPYGGTTHFTAADQGDDATDSDIISSVDDYSDPRGSSAVIEVKDGAETAVDVGLLPLAPCDNRPPTSLVKSAAVPLPSGSQTVQTLTCTSRHGTLTKSLATLDRRPEGVAIYGWRVRARGV